MFIFVYKLFELFGWRNVGVCRFKLWKKAFSYFFYLIWGLLLSCIFFAVIIFSHQKFDINKLDSNGDKLGVLLRQLPKYWTRRHRCWCRCRRSWWISGSFLRFLLLLLWCHRVGVCRCRTTSCTTTTKYVYPLLFVVVVAVVICAATYLWCLLHLTEFVYDISVFGCVVIMIVVEVSHLLVVVIIFDIRYLIRAHYAL